VTGRSIQRFKPLLTTAWHLLEGFLIEIGQQSTDTLIQLRQGDEGLMTQFSHNPAFNQQNTGLRLGFIFGL